MSLHVSEPHYHQGLSAKGRGGWTCDVIETDSDTILETTLPRNSAAKAQAHAQRIIARRQASLPHRTAE